MNYIEIKNCKKGYILKGESNHKVYKDEHGNTIRGHFMIFLEGRTDDYFIIGCTIDWLDDRLSKTNITNTILKEFRKLYPLYEIMKHKH